MIFQVSECSQCPSVKISSCFLINVNVLYQCSGFFKKARRNKQIGEFDKQEKTFSFIYCWRIDFCSEMDMDKLKSPLVLLMIVQTVSIILRMLSKLKHNKYPFPSHATVRLYTPLHRDPKSWATPANSHKYPREIGNQSGHDLKCKLGSFIGFS